MATRRHVVPCGIAAMVGEVSVNKKEQGYLGFKVKTKATPHMESDHASGLKWRRVGHTQRAMGDQLKSPAQGPLFPSSPGHSTLLPHSQMSGAAQWRRARTGKENTSAQPGGCGRGLHHGDGGAEGNGHVRVRHCRRTHCGECRETCCATSRSGWQ